MCYSVIEGLKFLMPSHSLFPRRGWGGGGWTN
jgi:hypothetical protein